MTTPQDGRLAVTVTTLKDSLANVREFVTANLANGVDHLVVLLDAPAAEGQPEVAAWLSERPEVTVIATDGDWWRGGRPPGLNRRQRINANAVRVALRSVDRAEWLFHIDGDEVAVLDRAALAEVPATADAVHLRPLEAVAQMHPEGRPTLFKQLLDDDDLHLLATLGVIERAHNGTYLRGHVEGKSGVRPRSEAQLSLHRPVDAAGRPLEPYADPRLSLLHYESFSGEEFVRKWAAMVASGPSTTLRPLREATGAALRALLTKDLPAEVRERHLARIYERTRVDDVDTLAELGLLVEVDPAAGTHRPAALTDAERARFAAAIAEVAALPKARFHPSPPQEDRSGNGPGPGQRRGRRAQGRSG
ncbi:glycosyltransferase family 2 protein [Nocardioides sp. YIM 152588]|uniref:glycosyltransferase family 2 protein n=1 Tax=Nocardioides sp. YIM 152588 TaxID=3158259 RepID=UPI0032E37F38